MCCSLTALFVWMTLLTANGAIFALSVVGASTQAAGSSQLALSIGPSRLRNIPISQWA